MYFLLSLCFLDVVVPLFSVDVVVKDVVVEQFYQRTFVEQFIGGNVVFDVLLPIDLLDVEHDCWSLNSANSILLMSDFVVRDVVAKNLSISMSNFLLRSSSQMMLILPYVLLDVEDILDVERLVVHSLVVRSCCSKMLFSISLMRISVLNNIVDLIIVVAVVL